jgi:hypothetical protein
MLKITDDLPMWRITGANFVPKNSSGDLNCAFAETKNKIAIPIKNFLYMNYDFKGAIYEERP